MRARQPVGWEPVGSSAQQLRGLRPPGAGTRDNGMPMWWQALGHEEPTSLGCKLCLAKRLAGFLIFGLKSIDQHAYNS